MQPRASGACFPKDALSDLKDLRKGVEVNRTAIPSGCAAWRKNQATGALALVHLQIRHKPGLSLTDEDGVTATAHATLVRTLAKDREVANASLREHLSKMGNSIFTALACRWNFHKPGLCPRPSSTRCAGTLWRHWNRTRQGLQATATRRCRGAASTLP